MFAIRWDYRPTNTGGFLAQSQDGLRVISTSFLGDYASRSGDAGASWNVLYDTPKASDIGRPLAMSSNGARVVIGNSDGTDYTVHVSYDGGLFFVKADTVFPGAGTCAYIAMSGDGNKILVAFGANLYGPGLPKLYLSTDAGSTFSAKTVSLPPPVDGGWTCAAISRDGRTMMAGWEGGLFVTTTDWASSANVMPPASPVQIAMSEKAEFVYVLCLGGVFRSSDKGLSWHEITTPGGSNGIAVSDNGDFLVSMGARTVSFSDDYGATWVETEVSSDPYIRFTDVCIEGWGSRGVIARYWE